MCARFAQKLSARAYAERYGALLPEESPDGAPPPADIREVRPTDDALVLRRHPQTGALHLSRLRWGLVPVWAQDTSRAARLINARSESVTETASFRDAWRKGRRCIVPAEGFYEWVRRAGGGKQPMFFFARDGAPEHPPLALAGLWEGWKDPETGEWLRTFTILTCAPNALIAPMHDRMPVLLEAEDIPAYLEADDPRALLAPYPAEKMGLEEVRPAAAGATPLFG